MRNHKIKLEITLQLDNDESIYDVIGEVLDNVPYTHVLDARVVDGMVDDNDNPISTITPNESEKRALKLIETFFIKPDSYNKNVYLTNRGAKYPIGVYETAKQIIDGA